MLTGQFLLTRPQKKIFPILNDLNNWEQWSPWTLAEPAAKITLLETENTMIGMEIS